VLVRSWNLFHGNTLPPGRRAFLREMITLVTADRPDIVCLQEVPGWALGRLGAWAGMVEVAAVAKRPSVGRVPVHASVGRGLTAPHHGILRSAFSGQGNSILVARGLRLVAGEAIELNPARERRVAQRVELELPAGGRAVIANLHCTHEERRADAELARVIPWAEKEAADALVVVAGDFNIFPERSDALRAIAGTYSDPIPASIDQVLVRGVATKARRWPPDEREYGGRLLSDHAPVEAAF
jgi:endonuclease/exonuclease/phosphatase family metal-dependent hydrolase